jgi:hypothetical protein
MSRLLNYLWLILLALYILSPLDAHPLFLDDIIATGVLFYLIYRITRQKQQQQYYYYNHSKSSAQSQKNTKSEPRGPLTLDEAYRILGVSPNASWDEISKAYKERMSKSHPDKVSHLSEELQEKAKELTLKLNEAYELVKRYKKS